MYRHVSPYPLLELHPMVQPVNLFIPHPIVPCTSGKVTTLQFYSVMPTQNKSHQLPYISIDMRYYLTEYIQLRIGTSDGLL
jgi:hypothetical protein